MVTLNCLKQLMLSVTITEWELYVGIASQGYYTLNMTPNCINIKHCSAGMIVLVIVLTCLYWVTVVVGMFSLTFR